MYNESSAHVDPKKFKKIKKILKKNFKKNFKKKL